MVCAWLNSSLVPVSVVQKYYNISCTYLHHHPLQMITRLYFHSRKNINVVRESVWNISRLQKRYRAMMEGEQTAGVTLKFVTDKLKEFASTALAQKWDNVGLLLEPARKTAVTRILLTNDLTEDVMDEALLTSANLIISYHPPIFMPLTRITNATWKERIISKCLANDIAIYSPHTSWDVVQGGVNDWLASAFACSEVKPLVIEKQDTSTNNCKYILTIESNRPEFFTELKEELRIPCQFKLLHDDEIGADNRKFTVRCDENALKNVAPKLKKNQDVQCYYIHPEYTVSEVSGIGRMCKLDPPISIRDAVDKLKKHIGTPFVQLALARNSTPDDLVRTAAFVAGSGASLLKNVFCDLKITGEASHHEVLDWIHNGSSVVLTNHSNSERGFLWQFKEILASKLENPTIQIVVSTKDADPLKVC